MKPLKQLAVLLFFGLCLGEGIFGSPLHSPAWGFWIDLPEGYEYADGDGKDRFSFQNGDGASFDLVVYPGTYQSIESLVADIGKRLKNQGDTSYFDYHGRKAALLELHFTGNNTGWGLCVEMDDKAGDKGKTAGKPTLLLALAYGPAGKAGLEVFHLSSLDSIAPSEAEQRYCGPVTDFSYPRGELKKTGLAGLNAEALIAEHDDEGAQALVDREFTLLRYYLNTPVWQEAWIRFYRAIYRDSWERIADAAFQLERYWAAQALYNKTELSAADLAARALTWVQSFIYERDLMGSDFVNLVSAVREGRGDCDSRAMLWAMILSHADIPSCIMVSQDYSHAMGLADIAGTGARFAFGGKNWLVAETTAAVGIGLIDQNASDPAHWLGIRFE
jgi:hypothetical protein